MDRNSFRDHPCKLATYIPVILVKRAMSFLIDSGAMEFYCVLYVCKTADKDKRDWISLNAENAHYPVEENIQIETVTG